MALFKRSQRTADIIKAYKHIFNSKEGQVVLYDLMNNSNFLRPTYSSKCPNVQTHLNEGKRELVLYILTKFQTDPKIVLELMKRGADEEARYAISE